MVAVPLKYGFPLFCKDHSTSFLLKNNNIRVSDIWSFWNYIIRKNFPQINQQNFIFSLLEQAKFFYITAESAPLKSQPLLYYYSFLNLSKIIINMNNYKGSGAEYYHGLETKTTRNTTLKNAQVALRRMDPQHRKYSVAYELMSMMGCRLNQIPPAQKFNVKVLLKNCVGIHRTFCEIYNTTEQFYHIKDVNLSRCGKKLNFHCIVSKIDSTIQTFLNQRGYNIVPEYDDKGNLSCYKWEEILLLKGYNVTLNDYFRMSELLYDKGIWTFTDGINYRTYISFENKEGITSECIIYSLMFFFGSITRYNPNIFDSLLTDKEFWMISEFLKTQPSQFLLLVTSKAIGHAILRPRTVELIR